MTSARAKKPRSPIAAEALPDATAPRTPAPWVTWVARGAEALLPTADGGPPPILKSVRGGLLGWIEGSIGLLLGCAIGLVVTLAVLGLPGLPESVVAFGVGILVGASAVVVAVVRRRGNALWAAISVLFLPILLFSAPLLLLYSLVAFVVGLGRRRDPKGPEVPDER